MGDEKKLDGVTHAYPTARPHGEPPRLTMAVVVTAPIDDCWLCQEGLCVQTREGDVIAHSPTAWRGGDHG